MRWFDSGRGHFDEAVSEAALRFGAGPDTHFELAFVYQPSTTRPVAPTNAVPLLGGLTTSGTAELLVVGMRATTTAAVPRVTKPPRRRVEVSTTFPQRLETAPTTTAGAGI